MFSLSVSLLALVVGTIAFWMAFKARRLDADLLVLLMTGTKFFAFGLIRMLVFEFPESLEFKFGNLLIQLLGYLAQIPDWLLMMSLAWRGVKSEMSKNFQYIFFGLAVSVFFIAIKPYFPI
jgi:hypothetical protein